MHSTRARRSWRPGAGGNRLTSGAAGRGSTCPDPCSCIRRPTLALPRRGKGTTNFETIPEWLLVILLFPGLCRFFGCHCIPQAAAVWVIVVGFFETEDDVISGQSRASHNARLLASPSARCLGTRWRGAHAVPHNVQRALTLSRYRAFVRNVNSASGAHPILNRNRSLDHRNLSLTIFLIMR